MIKSIFDMNISDYIVKEGDVKINADELKQLFSLIEKYHSMLCVNLDELNEEEKKTLDNGLQLVEYLQNKYLVLGDLRRKQKQWYDILKKLDNKEFAKNVTPQELDSLRREVWGYYLKAKTERENLQKEIDHLKEENFQ